jgi:hypothetical protein
VHKNDNSTLHNFSVIAVCYCAPIIGGRLDLPLSIRPVHLSVHSLFVSHVAQKVIDLES